MNCFQIVSLKYWAHLKVIRIVLTHRCELLSDCIFEILSTPWLVQEWQLQLLWIAFRLYLWNTEHTYRYEAIKAHIRCELLSDCIFEILSTPTRSGARSFCELWIAFRLYLWNTEHTRFKLNCFVNYVVNCFQIVSLKYWAHRCRVSKYPPGSCELLSDCIFEILSTPSVAGSLSDDTLWIAFRLYLWNTEHTIDGVIEVADVVVNCFQIVSLKYWAHRR